MKQIGERTTKKYSLRFKDLDWIFEWIQSDPFWKYPNEDWNIYLGEKFVTGVKNDYGFAYIPHDVEGFEKIVDELIEYFFDQIKGINKVEEAVQKAIQITGLSKEEVIRYMEYCIK